MKKLLLILGPLVLLIALLMPRTQSSQDRADHIVHQREAKTTNTLVTHRVGYKKNPSLPKGAQEVVSVNHAISPPQTGVLLASIPARGTERRRVEATSKEEEAELLQLEMAFDRKLSRDPEITERWFELRKQSRLLREGMPREEVIRLLGVATRDGSLSYGFDWEYSPKSSTKKLIDRYQELGVTFDSLGKLKEWDWYNPVVN